jgi:hypothetical protein
MKDSLRCALALLFVISTASPVWAQIFLGQTENLAVAEPVSWGLLGLSSVALVAVIVWHRRRNKHALDREYNEDELFEE